MKTFVILAALLGIGTQIQFEPGSRIWVEGGSTVRDWSCDASEFTSSLNTTGESEVSKLIDAAVVTIPVGKLECGNGTMNGHLRKALKADQNPNMEFRLKSYRIVGDQAVMLGSLSMAGVARDIEMAGKVETEGDLLRISGSTPITMSEWGVRPPSLMLGTMKVRDDVTVGFNVTLKQN